MTSFWAAAGTYFEACSCLPICPCRQVGGRDGGRSTFGVCDFALSWMITSGHAGPLDLAGRNVVMIGTYNDDQAGSPWTVSLFVDHHASIAHQDSLADIFLGRAGGTPARNYAGAIHTIAAVRPARVTLDHRPRRWTIRVEDRVEVTARDELTSPEPVACGIPGLDHPGQEVRARTLRVHDTPFEWEWDDRCGFATNFDYRSDS